MNVKQAKGKVRVWNGKVDYATGESWKVDADRCVRVKILRLDELMVILSQLSAKLVPAILRNYLTLSESCYKIQVMYMCVLQLGLLLQ